MKGYVGSQNIVTHDCMDFHFSGTILCSHTRQTLWEISSILVFAAGGLWSQTWIQRTRCRSTVCRDRAPDGRGAVWRRCTVLYCTVLWWNVFVDIIKEPYISAAAPQGLLLPADLHTGRWVMKQASLEIHHCEEPRRFSPSLPPTLFSFFFLSVSVLVCWMCYSTSGSNTWTHILPDFITTLCLALCCQFLLVYLS